MYIAKNEKNLDDLVLKYDLTMYKLGLNKKDRKQFYLAPIEKDFKLSTLRFITESADERLLWYKHLANVMEVEDTEN